MDTMPNTDADEKMVILKTSGKSAEQIEEELITLARKADILNPSLSPEPEQK
jgi:hypothetical protein